MADIVERLLIACNGHPYAKIPWPHRVLHEAVDEIERMRKSLREIEDSSNDPRAVREARAALGGKP